MLDKTAATAMRHSTQSQLASTWCVACMAVHAVKVTQEQQTSSSGPDADVTAKRPCPPRQHPRRCPSPAACPRGPKARSTPYSPYPPLNKPISTAYLHWASPGKNSAHTSVGMRVGCISPSCNNLSTECLQASSAPPVSRIRPPGARAAARKQLGSCLPAAISHGRAFCS